MSSRPHFSIIMRSFNEAWALKETLPALAAQLEQNWELIVIDSGSSDGSQELIRAARPRHFVQIRPEDYNPSRVLNLGARLAAAETLLFLNADATPQGSNWLSELAAPLQRESVAACFGRQIPRPDCRAPFACDYDRCFGEPRESAAWDHFFSMVSSGLRKDVWEKRGFREDLQYAEDDEYTRWCLSEGYEVVYVPSSVVMHSHNYTPEQCYRRAYGDARAMGLAGNTREQDDSWCRTVALGWVKDIVRDFRYCRQHHRLPEFRSCLQIRWQQRRGRLAGIRDGRVGAAAIPG
jgi:rhamnosyltransferase